MGMLSAAGSGDTDAAGCGIVCFRPPQTAGAASDSGTNTAAAQKARCAEEGRCSASYASCACSKHLSSSAWSMRAKSDESCRWNQRCRIRNRFHVRKL